jgi:hypothetical protein
MLDGVLRLTLRQLIITFRQFVQGFGPRTVTVKLHESLFPAASVAVHFTVVVPIGNTVGRHRRAHLQAEGGTPTLTLNAWRN